MLITPTLGREGQEDEACKASLSEFPGQPGLHGILSPKAERPT